MPRVCRGMLQKLCVPGARPRAGAAAREYSFRWAVRPSLLHTPQPVGLPSGPCLLAEVGWRQRTLMACNALMASGATDAHHASVCALSLTACTPTVLRAFSQHPTRLNRTLSCLAGWFFGQAPAVFRSARCGALSLCTYGWLCINTCRPTLALELWLQEGALGTT